MTTPDPIREAFEKWAKHYGLAVVPNFEDCRIAHNAGWQAAMAHKGAEGWQSIETAPRDGTEVWAFNGEQARMRWIEGPGYALWVWVDALLEDADPSPDQPTHWQPLPATPGSSRTGRNDQAKMEIARNLPDR